MKTLVFLNRFLKLVVGLFPGLDGRLFVFFVKYDARLVVLQNFKVFKMSVYHPERHFERKLDSFVLGFIL